MAISSRKISSFAERTQLDGSEYLMVAFNNRSYKVKTSLFTSDMIDSITQQVARGDGESSRITITTSGGESFDFFVRNCFVAQFLRKTRKRIILVLSFTDFSCKLFKSHISVVG